MYNDIDDEMLNFETIHKIAIKINNATKFLKKLTVIISNKNRFKHWIKNQFFVLLSISKIDIFIFSMTKCTFKTENENQLIQMLFDLIFALRAQVNQSFVFAVSIDYFRNAFNVVVT